MCEEIEVEDCVGGVYLDTYSYDLTAMATPKTLLNTETMYVPYRNNCEP